MIFYVVSHLRNDVTSCFPASLVSWVLRFSQRSLWGLLSSEMWYHVVWICFCCCLSGATRCFSSLPKRAGYRNHFWGESTQGADYVTSSDCEKWLIGKSSSLTWTSDLGRGDIFHVCVKGPGAMIFSVHTAFSIGRANWHHVRRMSELCNYEIIKMMARNALSPRWGMSFIFAHTHPNNDCCFQ